MELDCTHWIQRPSKISCSFVNIWFFVFLKIWLNVEWMVAGRFHLRGWLHKTICWPAPSWENCSNKQEASSHRRGDAANLSVGNCQHLLVVEEKKMRNGLRRDKETGGLDQGNPGPEPGFSGSPLSGDTMVIARDFLSLLYFSYHLSVTVVLVCTKGWSDCKTFTTSDIHHPQCKIRRSPPQTFTTPDVHHLRRSPPQTLTTPDIHQPRHSPPPV